MWIVPKESVEKFGDLKKPESIIGTGPWMLERYEPGTRLVYTRNPNYFVPGLPYADGVSLRRGSFQAVSQLAIPLVTTHPEQADEFDAMPALKAKIEGVATALCAADASPEAFAEALVKAAAHKADAFGVALDSIWREAADRHLAFYDALAAPAARNAPAALHAEPAE